MAYLNASMIAAILLGATVVSFALPVSGEALAPLPQIKAATLTTAAAARRELRPCTPTSAGTPDDPDGCTVARCQAPPSGCTLVSDLYEYDLNGNCCARQCYFVDSDGNECTLPSLENPTSAPTVTAAETPVDDRSNIDPDFGVDVDQGGGGGCFSGTSTVVVKGRGKIQMEDLRVGDDVWTGRGNNEDQDQYSKVYSFAHYGPQQMPANCLRIATKGAKESIDATPDHLLFVRDNKGDNLLLAAGEIREGHLLVGMDDDPEWVVESISSVRCRGLYAPLSISGSLVVNGVLTSNYVTVSWFHQNKLSTQMQHWLQHSIFAPYRLYCTSAIMGPCNNETYHETTGYSKWVMVLYNLDQWRLQLPSVLQTFVLGFVTLPSALAMAIGKSAPDNTSASSALLSVLATLAGLLAWVSSNRRTTGRLRHSMKQQQAPMHEVPVFFCTQYSVQDDDMDLFHQCV